MAGNGNDKNSKQDNKQEINNGINENVNNAENNIENNQINNIKVDNIENVADSNTAPNPEGKPRETIVQRDSSRQSAAPIIQEENVIEKNDSKENKKIEVEQPVSVNDDIKTVSGYFNDIQKGLGSSLVVTEEKIKFARETFEKQLKKIPANKQPEAFLKMFKSDSEVFFKRVTSNIAEQKGKGKNVNIVEFTKGYDEYRQQLFELYKKGNPNLKGVDYPQFGGVDSSKINGMMVNIYNHLPKKLQNKEEYKQISDYISASNIRAILKVNDLVQENKKEKVQQVNKQEEKKVITPQPSVIEAREKMIQDASMRMNKEYVNFQKKYGAVDASNSLDLVSEKKAFDEKIKALPPEKRGEEFVNEFKKYSQTFFNEKIRQISKFKNEGKNINIVAGTMECDAYLRKVFEFYKMGNTYLDGINYPQFGGVRAANIKTMQLKAFSSIPASKQKPSERKQINDYYSKNVINQRGIESKNFSKFIEVFNKREGLNFNAKGIEKYFQNRWSELGNKPLNEKQDLFNKEIRKFSEKAFERMNKTMGFTNYGAQMEDFDRLTTGLQELCKSKGYLDANKPNDYLGGLSPNQIKTMQLNGLARKPQNIQDQALENVKDITGFEVSKNNNYKQKFGETYSELSSRGRVKNFNKSIDELLAKVPACDPKAGGENNRYFVEATKAVYGLEMINNSRSRAWKFFHRREHKAYTNAVNKIIDSLNKKNYTKESILNQGKAKPNSTNDAIFDMAQKQRQQIDKLFYVVSEKQNQRTNEQIDNSLNNDREKLTIPEADNTAELLNPKEKSPFIKSPELNKTINNLQVSTTN